MKLKAGMYIFVGLGGFAVVLAFLAILARPVPDHPFFNQDDVLVIAHRGGRNLWPENTLYAFERALELGVDVLEMDIHSTSDGAIVVMHDEKVDRTTDGMGLIQDYSLEKLQELDAGYNWSNDDGATFPYRGQGIRVPTLEAIFVSFSDFHMNIEIKQSVPSIVDPLCRLIHDHDIANNVLVASFDTDTVKEFREACPKVATTMGEDEVRMLYIMGLLYLGTWYRPTAEAVQVPEYSGDTHVLTERFVQAAHGRNLDVHVWTVNDPTDMQRMLDLGVDGIITDDPDTLLGLLGR